MLIGLRDRSGILSFSIHFFFASTLGRAFMDVGSFLDDLLKVVSYLSISFSLPIFSCFVLVCSHVVQILLFG